MWISQMFQGYTLVLRTVGAETKMRSCVQRDFLSFYRYKMLFDIICSFVFLFIL